MLTDWKTPFIAAINEHDPTQKRRLCDLACLAINDRIFDQEPDAADAKEIEMLEEGLRQLALHRQDKSSCQTSDSSDSSSSGRRLAEGRLFQ